MGHTGCTGISNLKTMQHKLGCTAHTQCNEKERGIQRKSERDEEGVSQCLLAIAGAARNCLSILLCCFTSWDVNVSVCVFLCGKSHNIRALCRVWCFLQHNDHAYRRYSAPCLSTHFRCVCIHSIRMHCTMQGAIASSIARSTRHMVNWARIYLIHA